VKKFLFGLLLSTALISTVQAETQTYSTITDSSGFYHRKSTRVTSATTIANENVDRTKANISSIVSSTIAVTTTIIQMLKDGTVISTTNVAPSATTNIVTIAGPLNFQKFKVSPTTIANGLLDVDVVQSQ
jgi:hypothetical protein